MTEKEQKMLKAEKFVHDILIKDFNQKVDPGTLRAVAEKVSRAVDVKPAKRSPPNRARKA